MENKHEEKERIRKPKKLGERTQKLISFRIDLDLLGWLETSKNKGRSINNAIRREMEEWKRARNSYEDDTPHEDIEDTQT